MRTIILDIETEPRKDLWDYYSNNIQPKANLKDPVKIEEDIKEKRDGLRKKMAVDTDLCLIAMVGIKDYGQEPEILTLEEFCSMIDNETKSIQFVTFGGKRFDFPAIIKSAASKGLITNYQLLQRCTKKYDTTTHIDLEEILGGNFRSKNEYAKIYLGLDIDDFDFDLCNLEELKEHCKEDLIVTERLYELFKGALY